MLGLEFDEAERIEREVAEARSSASSGSDAEPATDGQLPSGVQRGQQPRSQVLLLPATLTLQRSRALPAASPAAAVPTSPLAAAAVVAAPAGKAAAFDTDAYLCLF